MHEEEPSQEEDDGNKEFFKGIEDERANEKLKNARARKGLLDMQETFSAALNKLKKEVEEKIEHVELLKQE